MVTEWTCEEASGERPLILRRDYVRSVHAVKTRLEPSERSIYERERAHIRRTQRARAVREICTWRTWTYRRDNQPRFPTLIPRCEHIPESDKDTRGARTNQQLALRAKRGKVANFFRNQLASNLVFHGSFLISPTVCWMCWSLAADEANFVRMYWKLENFNLLRWNDVHVENFLLQNCIIFSVLGITQAKQIINLLLLNNFYLVIYRWVRKEIDELLCTVW